MLFAADPDVGTSIYLNQLAWSPPEPPQGIILHYNIRITSPTTNQEIVPLVEGVTDTFFDLRPYVLSDGEYLIEVSKNLFDFI